MKHRLVYGIICGAFAFCFVIGIVTNTTFTNITAQHDYMEQFYVAELSDGIVDNVVETMRETLPDSKYILEVEATGVERVTFRSFMQEVEVKEIIQATNDDIKIGDIIYITKSGWSVYCRTFSEDHGYMIKEYGFVNKMISDKEYLVFLDHKVNTTLDRNIAHEVYDLGEHIVDPIFCYEDIENIVIPVSEIPIYVSYDSVKNNEFFVCSTGGMEKILELKTEMLIKYSK